MIANWLGSNIMVWHALCKQEHQYYHGALRLHPIIIMEHTFEDLDLVL